MKTTNSQQRQDAILLKFEKIDAKQDAMKEDQAVKDLEVKFDEWIESPEGKTFMKKVMDKLKEQGLVK